MTLSWVPIICVQAGIIAQAEITRTPTCDFFYLKVISDTINCRHAGISPDIAHPCDVSTWNKIKALAFINIEDAVIIIVDIDYVEDTVIVRIKMFLCIAVIEITD